VADVFGLHLSGLLAWVVWAFIHLIYNVTFQNRLLVFVQWAFQDLTFNRGARLITGVVPTDFNLNKELSSSRSAPALKAEPATSAVKSEPERVHLEQRLGHG